MIEKIKGNLLEAQVNAIAHGCNCQGIMNAGIAKDIKEKYPKMYKEYKSLCQTDLAIPGQLQLYIQKDSPYIINLFTQNTIREGATLEYIDEATKLLAQRLSEYRQKDPKLNTLGMPKIGCGLGRLNWKQVKPIIESNLKDLDMRILIYYL